MLRWPGQSPLDSIYAENKGKVILTWVPEVFRWGQMSWYLCCRKFVEVYVQSDSMQGETGVVGPMRRLIQKPREKGWRDLLQGQRAGARLERAVCLDAIRHWKGRGG